MSSKHCFLRIVWCPSSLTKLLHTPFPFNREEEGGCKPYKVVLILNSYSSLHSMSLFLRKSVQVVKIKYHRFEAFKQQLFSSYCSMTKQSMERDRLNLLVDETFCSTCRLPLFHYLMFLMDWDVEEISFLWLPFYTKALMTSQKSDHQFSLQDCNTDITLLEIINLTFQFFFGGEGITVRI